MSSEFVVQAKKDNDTQVHVTLDKFPDECPICHRGQRPHYSDYSFFGQNSGAELPSIQAVFRCVYEDCQRVFIALYGYFGGKGLYVRSSPSKPSVTQWSENIQKCSSEFVVLYGQAEEAEQRELEKIAGPGYRKALEFLIKDWLIAAHPEKVDDIRSKFLGNCIKDDIEEQSIKDVAERASWLGNDETHYMKVWDNKDINDLKGLIKLTAYWIDMKALTVKAMIDMPGKES